MKPATFAGLVLPTTATTAATATILNALTTTAVAEITPAQINALGTTKMEYLNQVNAAKLNGDVTDWLYSKGYTLMTGSIATGSQSVSGIETSNTVTAGTGTTKIVAGKSSVTITGSTTSETIEGSPAADIITGGSTADTINGNEGSDTFNYPATTDLFASKAAVDSITGGDGNDIITVGSGTGFAIANDDTWERINTVETIKANANSAAVTIALDVTAQTAGISKVDLSAVTAATGNSIDVSEYTTLATTLIGPSATTSAANIKGGAGVDTITAAAGGGTITAGGGLDKITLGAGADIVVLDVINANSLDTITGFTGGAGGDKIKLGGAGGAVVKTVAQLAASTESNSVLFHSMAASETFTLAGVTVTASGAVSATTIGDAFATLAAGGTPKAETDLSYTGTLTGWTTGSNSSGTVVFTSTTASTNVTDLAFSTVTGTQAGITKTEGGVVNAGEAQNMVFDTAANLGALGINLGNHIGATNLPTYAVAFDTGAIYYDTDGNWTTGAVQIGTIGVVANLADANFIV
jgi:hypothetical protein